MDGGGRHVKLVTLAALLALLGAAAAAAPRLPNIVLIVPDDLGRHDVSFLGGDIATPNIDRIAREGTALTRFYTARSARRRGRAS